MEHLATTANSSRDNSKNTAVAAGMAPPVVFLLVFACAALCFGLLGHAIDAGVTRPFDTAVDGYFHTHQSAPWHAFLTVVSFFAGPLWMTVLVCALALAFALRGAFWPSGFSFLLAGGGGELLVMALKLLFHRPRPYEVFSSLGYSFPSGHSFFSLTIYGLIAYMLARDAPPVRRRLIYGVAIAGVLLVGFSRVALTVHYPSDVLGGYTVALPWLWGCAQLKRFK